ncbi:hypothetical protein SORDD14_01351 [Streptococcus oralis]|uniref:Uncharacterized protein n=1 Tax=Streptococcus oralis TaxID=1303 RepID=A0A139NZP5_STROR|nr:hypothetical protein SORDD14_01351 [Streptococcus oralis]
MDSPFIFRGVPRLSILFYTIFHKKASQNRLKREELSSLLLIVLS